MTRILLLLCSLLFTISASSQGRIVRGVIQSRILKCEKPYVAYLPSAYDENTQIEYPVLYLLHGARGTCDEWTKKGYAHVISNELIASQLIVPMIIIMPDARGVSKGFTGQNMGYFNQPNWDYEDFFFEEFIPEIEKIYRINSRKESRAISGLSMGGGGAAAYAQRHPELFGYAAPLSSLVDSTTKRLYEYSSVFTQEFINSVGNTSPLKYVKSATEEEAEALRSIKWYFDCGDDDFLCDTNLDLFLEMQKKDIPMEFRIRNGGHTWTYWIVSLPEVLKFISLGFTQNRCDK